jgi:hypothetical protein
MEPTPVRPVVTERVESPGQRRRDGRTPGQRRGQARRPPQAEEPAPATEEPDVGSDPPHSGRLDVVV